MMNLAQPIPRALIGAAAASAMMVTGAGPAFARHGDQNGISTGEVIAGALIIGGIAAIAASAGDKDDYRNNRHDGRDGYNRRYRGGDSARNAVERCVRAAEREALRHGYRRADVTDIRDVDRKRYGYKVKGRIAVDTGHHRGRYGRGWGNDYRGWNESVRGWDSGNFTCKVDGRRVADLDFKGIRGLR